MSADEILRSDQLAAQRALAALAMVRSATRQLAPREALGAGVTDGRGYERQVLFGGLHFCFAAQLPAYPHP